MTLPQKLSTSWQPIRASSISLVDQLVDHLGTRIRNHGLRAGTRLPSVRSMADESGLSRFTVVQAYDRLVAQGIIQSRRGSGFYVSPPAPSTIPSSATRPGLEPDAAFDTVFLLRSMFREDALPNFSGSAGLLPASWMDHEMVATAIRSVGRSISRSLVSYGVPKGLKALRQQISLTLHAQDVPAHPDLHLMTVAGVTHGLDLISRTFIKPGDTVLVEDPGWFLVFGRLAALGAKVIGVPRLADGPDTQSLAALAEQHRPKLFITNTAVHNPTGHTLSAGVAYEILRIAERFNFLLVEDDTYADFHPGAPVRLAALDRLNRVLLVGGYSKTLAASLRVGYVAGAPALIDRLVDTKLLGALTTPELGEHVLHRILAEGHYRRHVERLRTRVDHARDQCIKMLLQAGCAIPHEPHAGMFVWADCGMDTEMLARRAAAAGVLFAPGVLFSPVQAPSSRFRLAVSMVDDSKGWQTLEALLKQANHSM
ncbi:PLP-dependent aminotransferase family protein [Pusillimonas sp. MFBS29]|uniref:aminotransferase-like domain-containing protein n=1 Tax=Pusillimonas sp. MFBS29 TaxID=2886690 RepID=UPI001D0F6E25|nr:PLP-dependent aminotransferase family protein [Pusillimonas sp. MFBS29]MCC2596526.1 PLP-dependent aminotransferase family protein [Pusillimonas sp. MFBS29]